jgi:hypothetical protein
VSSFRFSTRKIAIAAFFVIAAAVGATVMTAIASAHHDEDRQVRRAAISRLEDEIVQLRVRVGALEAALDRSKSKSDLRLESLRAALKQHRAAFAARISAIQSAAREDDFDHDWDKASIEARFDDWDKDWDHDWDKDWGDDWDHEDWDHDDWDHDGDDWEDD